MFTKSQLEEWRGYWDLSTSGNCCGIDEYSRRKGHRYNTLIVDLDRGKPIATFKGRRAEEVIAWFKGRPQAERDQVEVVVLAMSKTYASAINGSMQRRPKRSRSCANAG